MQFAGTAGSDQPVHSRDSSGPPLLFTESIDIVVYQ